MIDGGRSRVTEQDPLLDIRDRRIHLSVPHHPTTRWAGGWICSMPYLVRRQKLVVVVGIHGPGKLELPEVIHAGNRLCFRFRSGQSGQKHPGENGDDGDDHQQFDQGEGSLKFRYRIHNHALRY